MLCRFFGQAQGIVGTAISLAWIGFLWMPWLWDRSEGLVRSWGHAGEVQVTIVFCILDSLKDLVIGLPWGEALFWGVFFFFFLGGGWGGRGGPSLVVFAGAWSLVCAGASCLGLAQGLKDGSLDQGTTTGSCTEGCRICSAVDSCKHTCTGPL